MKKETRHKFAYSVSGALVRPVVAKFNFHTTPYVHKEDWPYVVLANHNTDYDPLMIRETFSDQMYFVAAENILRMGILSKILVRYFDPIFRIKGKREIRTTQEMLRRLRAGYNICLFPEGNRSFNGATGYIFPATAKVVKKSGAGLITYRLSGGYLSSPRWSRTLRKGKMTGEIVGIYSPEDLAQMSADELHQIISRDLYEDAYERQEIEPVAYKGEKLAEGLESTLFTCPSCKSIGTLHTHDDIIECSCGYKARYDEYGYLVEEDSSRKTVRALDRWQFDLLREKVNKMCLSKDGCTCGDTVNGTSRDADNGKSNGTSGDTETLLFHDENISLREIGTDHSLVSEETGTLFGYCDRLVFENDGASYCFPFDILSGISIFGNNKMVINYKDGELKHYEMHGPYTYSALKYLYLYEIFKAIL